LKFESDIFIPNTEQVNFSKSFSVISYSSEPNFVKNSSSDN